MNIRGLLCVALLNVAFVEVTEGHGSSLGLLAPLLPIAAITGHSGLVTSGLAGAALLKLKAAAVVAGLFHLKRGSGSGHAGINLSFGSHGQKSHGQKSYGQKGHGQKGHGQKGHGQKGHGQKGHGWGWSRKRRSADANEARGETVTVDLNLKEYDPSLDEVLQYDELGCGLRLVCELSAAPEGALQEDEELILELFGRDGKAPNPKKASRGKLSYSYAALLGDSAQDSSACSKVYGRCPYTAQQVMQSLRDARV